MRGGVRLLVVEDDAKLAAAVGRGLRLDGYAVDASATATRRSATRRSTTTTAIVLDVMLPARGGLEVCRTCATAVRCVPVLMLTARGQVADRVRGLDAGADDYLAKPFDFARAARARCGRSSAAAPAAARPRLTVGDLVVDPATHEVRRAGEAGRAHRARVRGARVPGRATRARS